MAASGDPSSMATFDVRGLDQRHHEYVSSIPLWVPLVVAGIGVAGSCLGCLRRGLVLGPVREVRRSRGS